MLRRALATLAITGSLLGLATAPAQASCATLAGCSGSTSAPLTGWCRVFWFASC